MDCLPKFSHNISESLSDLMDSIGLDMETVMKKRRIYLTTEQLWTDMSTRHSVTVHHFGSQTEGTTTLGLNSDLDSLTCFNAINVVSSLKEWKKGSLNLIKQTDENTAPGYCKLRCVRSDKADFESAQTVSDDTHIYEGTNVYLKNTYLLNITEGICSTNGFPYIKKGPSGSGTDKIDFVTAFRYKGKKNSFLKFKSMRFWPSRVLREKAFSCDSFIVPVGHPRSDCQSAEWRISSSMTERILMFSLNDTQLKSYVITKMLKETFLKPHVGEAVTSYHCKNALLFAIANTNNDFWKRHNIFACICVILNTLSSFYCTRFCPQFVNPSVNLLDGKAGNDDCLKMTELIKIVIENELRFLLNVSIDNLGRLLAGKCSPMVHINHNSGLWRPTSYEKHLGITATDGNAWKKWLLLHIVFVLEFTGESRSYLANRGFDYFNEESEMHSSLKFVDNEVFKRRKYSMYPDLVHYIVDLQHNGFSVYTKEPKMHTGLDLEDMHFFDDTFPLSQKRQFKQMFKRSRDPTRLNKDNKGPGTVIDGTQKQNERCLARRQIAQFNLKPVSEIEFDLEQFWEHLLDS